MSKILVVDDEPFVTDMVEATLVAEGYEVTKVYSGEEAITAIESDPPDLILLDLMLPGMDGYEVSRQLQKDARFNHIPIVMLTAKSAIHDRVAGYERGADDYITKPFNSDELLSRVRAQLHHLNRAEKSSLTGLPANQAVQEAIKQRSEHAKNDWSIIDVEIEGFTAYGEVYSFQKGEEVLKQAAGAVSQAVKEAGNPDDFVGHVGGENFVVLTTPDKTDAITSRISTLFNGIVPGFFNETDRESGYFTFINHSGETTNVPLLTFNYDIVDNSPED
jgi:diguanylate cyclase (GGDEF)-like protein